MDSRYAVSGLDISHYQGDINWKRLAGDKLDFVFIKASEGRELQDHFFATNWKKAREFGLRRGAYHFFRPEVSAAKQAGNYFDRVSLAPGDLPPVLDVEHRGNLSPQELIASIKTWADMAETRYGVKPIIYTGQNFYNRFLAGQLDEYPLWLARYDTEAPVTVCGRTYHFWQYTDSGRLPGIKGNVDRNVFLVSHPDLSLLCIPPPAKQVDDLARFGE